MMGSITTSLFGATYLRISRDKGENEDTLQNHREIMAEFCGQNGYSYEIYEEIVSGGKHDIEERPQLQRLLNNIGKYQAIFTVSLDRLSRNGLISQQIKQLCMDHGIIIITPSQTFDLARSSEDCMLYDVSSMFAVLEYEMIGRRNKYNRVQRARRGEYVSGKPAYGYRRNPATSRLEIYEPEAEAVRYIFKLHNEGLGTRKIADILNSEGYRPQQCLAFLPATVKRMIQNPVYKGCLVMHDRKRIQENGQQVFKVMDRIVTDDAHPAIIPPEEWDHANRERVERGERAAAVREKAAVKTGTTMLKDLLFCGVCGRKLFFKKEKNGKYFVRHCEYLLPASGEKCGNHGMNLKFIEEDVLGIIQSHRGRFQKKLQHMQRQKELHLLSELRTKLTHLEYQIHDNEKQQAKLQEYIQAKVLPQEELQAKEASLLNREKTLREQKERTQQQIRELEAFPDMRPVQRLLEMFDQLPYQPPEDQNRILKQFIRRIHYTRQLPEDIQALAVRNREREEYPFRFIIEYF